MSQVFQILCEALPLATVVMVVALHFSLRRQLPATRGHQLLIAGCVLSMLSPVLVWVMPKWQVLPSVPVPFVLGQHSSANASVPAYPLWFRALAWLWVAGLLAGLAQLGRQVIQFRTLWRESACAPRALELQLARLAARRGLARPLRLRLHPGLESACTWGVRRPVILIPRSEAGQPLHELRMVLDHELAHIQRLDAASGWLLDIFAACFWFHPCARLISRRAELLKERACDDLVLLSGQRPAAYAACLGSTALRTAAITRLPRAACTFARRHPLLARLNAILDSRQARCQPSLDETFRAVTPITIFAVLLSSLGFKVASEMQPLSPSWIARKPGQPVPSLWSDVIQPAADSVVAVIGIPGPEPSRQIVAAPSQSLSASEQPTVPALARPSLAGGRPPLDAGLGRTPRITHSRSSATAPARSTARSQRFQSPAARSRGGSQYSAGISIPPTASAVAPGITTDYVIGESVSPFDSGFLPVTESAEPAGESLILPAAEAAEAAGGAIAAEATQVVDAEGISFVMEAVSLPTDGASSAIAPPGFNSTGVAADYPGSTSAAVSPARSGWIATPELVGIESELGAHFAVRVEVPVHEAAAWSAEASTDALTWTNSQEIIAQWIAPGTSAETVRIEAAVTEPIQSSSYRFLRLKANW